MRFKVWDLSVSLLFVKAFSKASYRYHVGRMFEVTGIRALGFRVRTV